MAAAGLAFASTRNFFFLLIAGTIGVVSPSGNEVGPFLSIEQAALSQVIPQRSRTELFAWYTLAGSLSTALGALSAGGAAGLLVRASVPASASYRSVVFLYALLGLALALLFRRLSSAVELSPSADDPASRKEASNFLGVHASRSVVLKLASLFALDSFAGGFVIQSFAAYWFYLRFAVAPAKLGLICSNPWRSSSLS